MADRIWALAQVVGCRPGSVRLRFSKPESCRRCQRGEGCGAGVFGGLFATGPFEVDLPQGGEWHSGDWVRVGIDRRAMVAGAISAYGLPLAAFLATIWLLAPATGASGSAEGFVLMAAVVAGYLAHLVGRRGLIGSRNPELEPLSAGSACDGGQ